MNRPDNKQARKWANEITESRQTNIRPDAFAAAELIQSLPDTVVDGDKLWDLVKKADEGFYSADTFLRRAKELLLTPPLPTLADMTPKERDTQKWMQAQLFSSDSPPGIITYVDEHERSALILFADGTAQNMPWDLITPLPGEPKLEWPGSRVDAATAESGGDVQTARVDDIEPALPRPEDVPSGEAWRVLYDGHEWVGTRDATGHTDYLWALARLDGVTVSPCTDREITLVSRLVREVKP